MAVVAVWDPSEGAFWAYLARTTGTVLNANGAYTICAWVKRGGGGTSGPIFAAEVSGGGSYDELYFTGTGDVGCRVSQSGTTAVTVGSSTTSGTWAFVVMRRSSTSAAYASKLVTGAISSSSTNTRDVSGRSSITANFLGHSTPNGDTSHAFAWVKAWNVELSDAELLAESLQGRAVRRANLFYEMPLWSRTQLTEWAQNLTFTESGGALDFDTHPRVVPFNKSVAFMRLNPGSIVFTPDPAIVTLTATNPTVAIALSVTPVAAQVSLTAVNPTVVLGSVAITPAVASVSLTAINPTVAIALSVAPAAASVSLTAVNPTVSVALRLTPAAASVALTAPNPTVVIVLPQAELALVCDLVVTCAAEIAAVADLDVFTRSLYRVVARVIATGVEIELGTVPATGGTIAGVALADGQYSVRVEGDGRYWRGARFRREWPVTIEDGDVVEPLPEILNLASTTEDETVFLTWQWEASEDTATPEDFSVWIGASEPVDTSGAPDVVTPARGPGGYLEELAASPTTFYVAVAARKGSQIGPVSTIAVEPPEEAIESPSGQSARIADGAWADIT